MSDDAQAVVVEVSKAVGTALEEFHFSMEALGDGIVFGEAPHGDESLAPVVKRFAEAHEGLEGALEQILDEGEKARDELAADAGGLVFIPISLGMLEYYGTSSCRAHNPQPVP